MLLLDVCNVPLHTCAAQQLTVSKLWQPKLGAQQATLVGGKKLLNATLLPAAWHMHRYLLQCLWLAQQRSAETASTAGTNGQQAIDSCRGQTYWCRHNPCRETQASQAAT